MPDEAAQPLVGIGQLRHARLRPVPHAFAYPTCFLLLPLRRLRAWPHAALARNRFALMSFHDRDHGDGRDDCLAWIDELLSAHGIADAHGEIWLHCTPRVLGMGFKPVSFWYCHRIDGTLTAIVAEVNNTFGERHCYLLSGQPLAFGRELSANKVFHVSPFCCVNGRYRFRFMRTANRTVVRIDHDDELGLVLRTSVSGVLEPLAPRHARSFLALPLLGLSVIARIHWQALKLWLKRVPWHRKPEAPATFVSR
jgi:hypothetical protein